MSDIKKIHAWLIFCCLMILVMVFIGGLTRSTDSGLSMVDWRIFLGIIPPLNEGDWLTLNGSSGKVYPGQIPLQDVNLNENPYFQKLMEMSDKQRKLNIRTNADSPNDAILARSFGAKGIGLCRTEHMFFDPNRISAMREMIVANNEVERRNAIMKLLPFQKTDFYGILKAMAPHPVTIRLLDPTLHEFLPQEKNKINDRSN